MKDLKTQIIELRSEGKTYNEIKSILGCSKGVIAYHANADVKLKQSNRQKHNRFTFRENLKNQFGGCCQVCKYNRCLEALEFHHLDESTKLFDITGAIWGKVKASWEDIQNEAKKCVLLCANCHREVHSKLISLN